MDTLLRKLAEWRTGGSAAQIIVVEGGAEVETSRAFVRGAVVGIGVASIIFVLTAPSRSDPNLLEELERREQLVRESQARVLQAVSIADVCLTTAQQLEQTLSSYQAFLSGRAAPGPGSILVKP